MLSGLILPEVEEALGNRVGVSHTLSMARIFAPPQSDVGSATWFLRIAAKGFDNDGTGGQRVAEETKSEPIAIKKYANRRLYNTASSAYVTLDNLCQMVKDGREFVVRDAKTGEDITRSVLTQIIFEEENKGQNLLPLSFLRKLISYYGHNLESLVPRYLESSLELFQRNQDAMQRQFAEAFGEPLKQFEEMGRQNMAVFERALAMFNPFAMPKEPPSNVERTPPPSNGPPEADLETLRRQLDDMRRHLDALTKDKT